MIQVERLTKSFKGFSAVHDLSFEVGRGEALGLLGPNGAGKTTTLRMLAGFFQPTSGRVLINGTDLFASPKELKRSIGYLPERVTLYENLLTRDYLSFVASMKHIPAHDRKKEVERVAQACGVDAVMNRFIGKLSQGFRQRIGLAQSLIGNPTFLILDEPTLGLDPGQVIQIRHLIQDLAKERTVILSSHILSEVSMVCSRVLILHKGILAATGTPGELAQKIRRSKEAILLVSGNPEALEKTLGGIEGVMAFRLESSRGSEHTFRILYKKEEDVRPLVSRLVVETGLELLSIHDSPVSLEDVFLKTILREEES